MFHGILEETDEFAAGILPFEITEGDGAGDGSVEGVDRHVAWAVGRDVTGHATDAVEEVAALVESGAVGGDEGGFARGLDGDEVMDEGIDGGGAVGIGEPMEEMGHGIAGLGEDGIVQPRSEPGGFKTQAFGTENGGAASG
jgi:hypothetical protein